MTREEAIERYEGIRYTVACFTGSKKDCDAVDMAFSALRPVSREQLDVVINSLKLRLENNEENGAVSIPKFAVEQMIELLEVIKNG